MYQSEIGASAHLGGGKNWSFSRVVDKGIKSWFGQTVRNNLDLLLLRDFRQFLETG